MKCPSLMQIKHKTGTLHLNLTVVNKYPRINSMEIIRRNSTEIKFGTVYGILPFNLSHISVENVLGCHFKFCGIFPFKYLLEMHRITLRKYSI